MATALHPQRIAIVGAGWAGMSAAVQLHQQGHHVEVFEASRTLGGRARALEIAGPNGEAWTLDNGQHILIGAYQACLQMMAAVGVDPAQALLRLPLDLRYADGTGLQLPNLLPPFDAALGIARTKGWSWRDKLALLRTAQAWQRSQFTCTPAATVADLCQGLPARLMQDFVDPLCISALNLPANQASGQIFLRVLQDGLFSGKGGSNLLIPRTDLSAAFPAPAAQWLQARGAAVHVGTRVRQLTYSPNTQQWQVNEGLFDAVVLATSSAEAARLVQQAVPCLINAPNGDALAAQATAWAATAHALPHTAIATVYAYAPPPAHGTLLPAPMVALRSSEGAPAQFAFDKAQLGGPTGVIALVVSASEGDKDTVQAQVLEQARAQLQLPQLQAIQTVIDKRATFACTPQVQRPGLRIALGLWACGDYVDGPYPATLEGAVRCGSALAQALSPSTQSN